MRNDILFLFFSLLPHLFSKKMLILESDIERVRDREKPTVLNLLRINTLCRIDYASMKKEK